jgi:hypothetical protein
MGLISWAWTNLAPPGANCAADSTTLVWGALELDLVVVILSVAWQKGVRRLRAHFRVPADLLLPPPKKPPPRRSTKRAAA